MPPIHPVKRRAALSACLALGVLLAAPPASAVPPTAPASPGAGAAHWQKLPLSNVTPADLLRTLRWDKGGGLPGGVLHVYGLESDNSLLVQATPEGLARAREIVKRADIAPRRVQIKFALARATDASLKASGLIFASEPVSSNISAPMSDTRYAAGSGVAAFLQTLTKQGAVAQTPVVTTTDNVPAILTLSTTPGTASTAFAATPRINADDSVTLVLHPVLADGAARREIRATRRVKSGDTLVLVFPGAEGKSANLLLFAAPTILPDGRGPAPQ